MNFTDLFTQLGNLPVGAQLVLAVVITGYVVKSIPQVPNVLIPLFTLGVAVTGNVMLGDMGTVSPANRNPAVMLGLGGVIYWGVGWLLHNQGLSRLEKFLPEPIRKLIGVPDKPDTVEGIGQKAKEESKLP